MTIRESYFFDTYALVQILSGSKNYIPYTNAGVIITKLNLFELFYVLLRLYGKQLAVHYLNQYKQFVIDFDGHDIEVAAELKSKNKKLSMSDCIGYVIALKNNIKLLTGDKAFEDMPNVEFVK